MTNTKKEPDIYLSKKLSLFRNHNEKGGGVEITVEEFFAGVRGGSPEWRKTAEAVRAAPDWNEPKPKRVKGLAEHEQPKREYDRIKSSAQAVTLSGTFREKAQADSLREPTGLIGFDLDYLNDRVDEIKSVLSQDSYFYSIFKSIGGRGLCCLVKIDNSRHKESFDAFLHYLLITYGLSTEDKTVDKSTHNINRLRYCTYDEHLYYNPDSRLFREYIKKADAKKWEVSDKYVDTERDIEHVIQQIEEQALEFGDSSGEWVRMGLALASKYGERGLEYFQRLSVFRHDYDSEDTEKRYLYWCRVNQGKVGIATFYFICKQRGLNIISPKTVEIVQIVQTQKKQSANQAGTVESLVSMLALSKEEAVDIVAQVYAAGGEIETQQTFVDKLESFLRTNYSLRFNEVTQQFEDADTGRSLNDSDEDAIYLHARKIVSDKVRFDDVRRAINQKKIFPNYHPFKDFFERNKTIKPTGLIYKLISCITTNTGLDGPKPFPQYAQVFFRKWLIGIVATIYTNDPNALVPILTGVEGTGKSWFFRNLLPPELEQYRIESNWADNRDEQRRLCTNLISYNDEFKGKDTKAIEHFKNLSSLDYVTLRLMFGRNDLRLKRLASMCASSNPTDVINEPEFNRRIIPIYVLSIDWDTYNSIDKVALFMELYHAFIAGEAYQLTREEMDILKATTEPFQNRSFERQLVEQWLSIPEDREHIGVDFCTTSDIKLRLEIKAGGHKLDLNRIGAAMQAAGFEKLPKWHNGKAQRGYYVFQHI